MLQLRKKLGKNVHLFVGIKQIKRKREGGVIFSKMSKLIDIVLFNEKMQARVGMTNFFVVYLDFFKFCAISEA